MRIFGHTWDDNPRQLREWIGISLQETRLSAKLNVRETIELFASFYREPRAAGEVLDELELTEKADAWVGKLSGGQKQRLAVATALVGNPRIRFLDETQQSKRDRNDTTSSIAKKSVIGIACRKPRTAPPHSFLVTLPSAPNHRHPRRPMRKCSGIQEVRSLPAH